MATTDKDRLHEIRLALLAARETRATLPDAATQAQRKTLQGHIDALELSFFRAGKAALDANSAAVEQAMTDAVAARKAVEDALKNAKTTAEKIRLVGKTVGTVGSLLKKASGQ